MYIKRQNKPTPTPTQLSQKRKEKQQKGFQTNPTYDLIMSSSKRNPTVTGVPLPDIVVMRPTYDLSDLNHDITT